MRTCLVFLFSFSLLAAKAQQKIGHANWDYIFGQLPEAKQIETELKSYESQLQNQYKIKSQELETKYKAYQGIPANTPDAIKKDKENELAFLQENLQKFQQDAQTSLQKKQMELMNPVLEKIGKAIETVAKENGYSYIINPQAAGGNALLLYSDEKTNISNLVLKKLGIAAPTSTTPPVKKN